MYKTTLQNVSHVDYIIPYPILGSSIIEPDIDDILDNLLFTYNKERLPRNIFHQNLSSIFEIDLSSVRQHFEVKNESSLMEKGTWEREVFFFRILNLVDKLMIEGAIFNKLDKKKLIDSLSIIVESISPQELGDICDKELTRRIKKIMAIEVLSGQISDFSQEQSEAFETALKRKDLFK